VAEDAEQLLRRIAQGDETAIADFYRLYESRIYRFVLSRLNDSFEAADILNEVMLEVWRGAGRFEGRSKVSTWVFGIARNKTIDRLRRKNPGKTVELEPDIAEDESPGPFDILSAAEDADHVRHCVEQLSESHREVVHLAFFEDLTYREIAIVANCPEGTVKTRMYHAKKALQRCLSTIMGMGS
jgi:RNA polymerase sigma-70 factor (ECF subfamily)